MQTLTTEIQVWFLDFEPAYYRSTITMTFLLFFQFISGVLEKNVYSQI